MKTTRIRKEIKIYLGDGKKNIVQLLEHINNRFRLGSTMQQLGNVLSKDEDIIKVGKVPRGGMVSGTYLISEWALKEQSTT